MANAKAELLARIEALLAERNLSAREASMLATDKPDMIRDLARAKGMPSGDRLQSLADVLGTTVEFLMRGADPAPDRPRTALIPIPSRQPRLPRDHSPELGPIPHLGAAAGIDDDAIEADVEMFEMDLGEVLEWVSRPAGVTDPAAYELTTVGDSMVPRFKPRDRLVISPREPVAIGDDVVVQLKGRVGDEERIKLAMVKELVRRTATHYVFRQHNPAKDFSVERARVDKIHKIKGVRF